MSEQQWQVLDGAGNNLGPYSIQDLQAFHHSGNISHDTLVWTDGMAEWLPAGQIPGLLPEAPNPEPPLVQAAPVAPIAQATPGSGINLSPQITTAQGLPKGPRTGAPMWISIATLIIALAGLTLAFFPWVSALANLDPRKGSELVTAFTQTGFQSVIGDISVPDQSIDTISGVLAKEFAEDEASQEELSKELKKEIKNADPQNQEWGISILNLIALIAVGLGAVLVLIGIMNRLSALIVTAQLMLVLAAALIGIQLAMQFPAIDSFVEAQKKGQEQLQADFAKTKKELQEASIDSEETASAINEQTKLMNQVLEAKLYATRVEPSCFVVVILLTASIFLLVITMSSASAAPVIAAPSNGQPLAGGVAGHQSPPQPGSGLKFH